MSHNTAVGCADLTGSVSGGWVRRDGDMTTVGCNDTDETWYLACRHGRWVGNVTGCSAGAGHTATGKQNLLVYLYKKVKVTFKHLVLNTTSR